MTTPSGTELTDEQLNKMVTEALGFYVHLEGRVPYASKIKEPNFGFRLFNVEPLVAPFSTSLDACATFEATITEKVPQAAYAEKVIQVVNEQRHGEHRFIGASDFDRVTATPKQRCIAFLRMRGVL